MIRKVNLIHHKHKVSIPGFADVQMSDIDSLINYSIDVIYCAILNKIDKHKINQSIDQIASKIRYGGQLVLVIVDVRELCKSYVDKTVTDQVFFETIKDTSENLSPEQIIMHLTNNHKLSLIAMEKNNYSIALSFQRNNHD